MKSLYAPSFEIRNLNKKLKGERLNGICFNPTVINLKYFSPPTLYYPARMGHPYI